MFKRLTDWWTRPSWEEYLAEHQACVDLYAKLEIERDVYKDSLHQLHIAGVKYADLDHQLQAHDKRIEGLIKLNKRFNKDANELAAENGRLRGLLAEPDLLKIESQVFGDLIRTNGEMKHWAVRHIVNSFADSIEGAEHFVLIEVGNDEHGHFDVTIKRRSGKSPARVLVELQDQVAALKASAEELLSLDGGSLYHPPGGPAQAIFDRARALLNTEKKD